MVIQTKNKPATATGISRGRLWSARIASGMVVLFMLFDGIGKIAKPAPVIEASLALGFKESHIPEIGVLGLLCTILYAVPRTRLLGALLLTAYLGGAVAAQVRVDNPLWSHTLFPVYIALLAWGAIGLRDRRWSQMFRERG